LEYSTSFIPSNALRGRGVADVGSYYVIEVSLKDITPRIWWRFMIRTDATFVDLHEAIQDACGWQNCHLFQFKDSKGRVLAELPGDEGDETGPDAMITRIEESFRLTKGKKILYIYDFGDQWEQDVKVVAVEKDWPEDFGRRLLAGERAFPPEDCGGLGGYEDCLEIVTGKCKDPQRLEWLEGWHPEKFDFKETARLFYQDKLFLRAHYDENL
jgi:hypothetical protein